MKHFKLKLSLTAVFILITALLCCGMVFTSSSPAPDYSGVTEFLKKRGITVYENAFDGLSLTFSSGAELKNSISDHEKLARAILGSSANALPSASNIFMLNNQNVVFNGNAFHFENNEKRDKYKYSGASADNADSTVEKISQKLGIDTSDSIITSAEEDKTVIYTVTKMLDGKPVYDNLFKIVIYDGYLKTLDGVWFGEIQSDGTTTTKNINNALVSFANMPDVPKSAVITSINTGYRPADISKQSTKVIPVCQITLDDGTVYYVDL